MPTKPQLDGDPLWYKDAILYEVHVRAFYDSAGDALEQLEIALEPWRLVQLPVSAPVVNGRARVEVLSGRVIAYASMIDNTSGDPIFVPAQ